MNRPTGKQYATAIVAESVRIALTTLTANAILWAVPKVVDKVSSTPAVRSMMNKPVPEKIGFVKK